MAITENNAQSPVSPASLSSPSSPTAPGLNDHPDANLHSAERAGTDMLARAVRGAHDTVDRLAETAAPHVQRLTQGVDSASETLSARAEHARDVGDEWADSLRTTVRENPIAAVLAAVAAGVLIARLTS